MSSGVACRHGSDSVLLWPWYRLVTVALIRPLAWGAHAMGAAPKRPKKKKWNLDLLKVSNNVI